MNPITAAWDLIRNPPMEAVDDDGTVVDRWQMNRRERLELMKPHWWFTILARQLPCGCTRRWWGSFTLYDSDCWEHFRRDMEHYQ